MLATFGHIFGCHKESWVLLAPSRSRPGMLLNVLQYTGPYSKERSGPAQGWCWGSETCPRAFFLDLALIPSAPHAACGQISGFYLTAPPASSSLLCLVLSSWSCSAPHRTAADASQLPPCPAHHTLPGLSQALSHSGLGPNCTLESTGESKNTCPAPGQE